MTEMRLYSIPGAAKFVGATRGMILSALRRGSLRPVGTLVGDGSRPERPLFSGADLIVWARAWLVAHSSVSQGLRARHKKIMITLGGDPIVLGPTLFPLPPPPEEEEPQGTASDAASPASRRSSEVLAIAGGAIDA